MERRLADQPREFTVSGDDITLEAVFAPVSSPQPAVYSVTLMTSDLSKGAVYGNASGLCDGERVEVVAVPAAGCRFAGWSDGSLANPRTLEIGGSNETLTAYFEAGGTSASAMSAGRAVVKSVEYYDLQGRKLAVPQRGVNVARMVYTDGTEESVRIQVK